MVYTYLYREGHIDDLVLMDLFELIQVAVNVEMNRRRFGGQVWKMRAGFGRLDAHAC